MVTALRAVVTVTERKKLHKLVFKSNFRIPKCYLLYERLVTRRGLVQIECPDSQTGKTESRIRKFGLDAEKVKN